MTAPTPISSDTQQWVMPAIEVANQAPAEVVDQAPAAGPRIGWWQRMTLTEPARLYLYGLLLVATAALQLAGYATDEWAEFAAVNGGLVLALGGATEAVRASVYSPAGVIRAARAAAAVTK